MDCERLVNIHAPKGIPANAEKTILQISECAECHSKRLRPIAFVRGEDNSAFLFECIDCHKNSSIVFTKRLLTTQNVIINIVERVGDLNKQISAEPAQGTCPKCHKGKYRSVDRVKCNRMALDIAECDSCHFAVPFISIVRSTLFAYSHDIILAKKVADNYPDIALVFCVSALETYFRQLFQYHNDLNKYLVENRRVNFQSLSEARTILGKEFDIDIMKLIEKDWDLLHENFKKRHAIIHNASYDLDGKKIRITKKDINKLFSIVDDLVYRTEMTLFNNDVII
jgi:hypothetical protein